MPFWRRIGSHFKKRIVLLHYLHNVLRGRRWNEPLIQMNRYDMNKVITLLLDHGITEYHASIDRLEREVSLEKSVLFVKKGDGISD